MPRRPTWKRRALRTAITILAVFLLMVAMLVSLQRWLIYFPTREARIDPEDAGLPVGRVHTITLKTDDDIQLHGWHVLPNGQAAADGDACDRQLELGRPLVLYFSGNAANRQYRTDEFEMFTRLGCDVFIFDYRGYAENAGRPSEKALTADARSVWKYATDERNVKPDRVILYGESLGGGVAVRLASDLSEAGTPPGAVILRSTFSSLVDTGSYHYPWLPVRRLMIDRFPSVDRIPSVTCPLLQIHGARDTIIPIQFGRKLFEAAPETSATGIPKRFLELAEADHNDVVFVAEREMRRAVGEFLEVVFSNQ
jgi:pimeloyl-ACP methyl ester carboxylesterase